MASKRGITMLSSFARSAQPTAHPLIRLRPQAQRSPMFMTQRFAHAIPKPPTASRVPASSSSSPESPSDSSTIPRKLREPHYELTFTCVPCAERSTHAISKQGYHHGSVLITCPSCRNRHVISDHLNIFGDRKMTIEDLMREKGQLVKRGTLGEDGDVEFWEDGTVTEREGRAEGTAPSKGESEA